MRPFIDIAENSDKPRRGDDIDAYLEVPHKTTAGGCRHDRTIGEGVK